MVWKFHTLDAATRRPKMKNLTSQDKQSIDRQRNPLEAESRKYMLKVTCSYCGKDMGTKPCDAANDGKVSHGCCPACEKIQREEIRKIKPRE